MKLQLAQFMAAGALAAIAENGKWTGNDFDHSSGISVHNGVPTSSDADMERRITSPQPIDGDVPDY
jgi:hypothetical protein